MGHAAPVTASPARPGSSRLLSLKVVLFSGITLILVGIVAVAATREATVADRPAATTAAGVRPVVLAPRPALSAAEQQYVEALWPIHTQVERAAVRVALGAAFYRLGDVDRVELKSRLDQTSTVFRDAEASITALAPPVGLQRTHLGYLDGVRLFRSSVAEMLKTYDDGDETHLTVGFPMSQQASDKIREAGSQLFPDEYPPN